MPTFDGYGYGTRPPRPRTSQATFAEVASIYDDFNDLVTFGRAMDWRCRAAQALVGGGPRLLDLATGTGRSADAMREEYRRAHGILPIVVGADLNEAMLRARGRDDDALHVQADGMRLPFRTRGFDGAMLAFCLGDMTRPVDVLAECARVVRPGGLIVVLDLARPPGFLGSLYGRLAQVTTSLVGRWAGLSGLASVGQEVGRYPGPQWTEQQIVLAGLRPLSSEDLHAGVVRLSVAEVPSSAFRLEVLV